jgi:hypothetical protein
MKVAVVMKDGTGRTVSKDELQFLLATRKIDSFQRSDGWVRIDRDKLRRRSFPYAGSNRREHGPFAKDIWY